MQAGGMRLSTDHIALYDTRILYSLLNNIMLIDEQVLRWMPVRRESPNKVWVHIFSSLSLEHNKDTKDTWLHGLT